MYNVELTLDQVNAMITALETRKSEKAELLERVRESKPYYPATEARLIEEINTLRDCIAKLYAA